MTQKRGIIRSSSDIIQVYNPTVNKTVDCYYDTYSQSYCAPGHMDEWLKLKKFTDAQWRFANKIEATELINCYNPTELVIGYTDIENNTYCIPDTIVVWAILKTIQEANWRFASSVSITKVINALDPTVEAIAYYDSDTDMYCVKDHVYVWCIISELNDYGWQLADSTTIVKVFNPEKEDNPIDCYYNTETEQYCIPDYIEHWVDKQTVMDTGWKFVDGIESLYLGSTLTPIIADSFPDD